MTSQIAPERIIYQKRADLQHALDRLYEERATAATAAPETRKELSARILQFESVLRDYDGDNRIDLPEDGLNWLHGLATSTTEIKEERRGRTDNTKKRTVPAAADADVDRLEALAEQLCQQAVDLGFGAETKTPVNTDPEPV